MRNNDSNKIPPSRPAAFFWDESFLWAVMAYRALEASGLDYDFISAHEIKSGRLKDYAMLFVPGGWAVNKLKALGEDGVKEIQQFVHNGGAYLGFCGGAGLATLDGLGLVKVKRKPTRDRVPSFSGRIRLAAREHPLWDGVSDPIFHAWWPSQFVIEDTSVKVLATYGEAMPDAFSSDVNVGDAEQRGAWAELERAYQINLDPKRLLHEPAVLEGTFGSGKVVLSLVHFDTLGDDVGAIALKNLWSYLAPAEERGVRRQLREHQTPASTWGRSPELEATTDLISLGLRNALWSWRNPLLLQWKRGVRGLEYCTLHIMMREIAAALSRNKEPGAEPVGPVLERIGMLLLPFVEKAKRLLLLEREAMQAGPITYERCDDPEIQRLREELFSRSKSHGGAYKILIDEIDALLFGAITRTEKEKR